MEEVYEKGIGEALRTLGLAADDIAVAALRARRNRGDEVNQYGAGYPEKNPRIGAERFARALQESQDDERPSISPDNMTRPHGSNNLDRHVTWASPTHLSENSPSSGMMQPANPRG